MKRQQATLLLKDLLNRAAGDTWPLSLVQSVHVFGSYARGALDPGDVDVAVVFDRDERWSRHFSDSLSEGRDAYTVLRVALRGRRRTLQIIFDHDKGGYDHIPMTLIWKRGESLDTAIERIAAIPEDAHAGRVPRGAMLPCFEGLDDHIPLFVRESFKELVDRGIVSVEQLVLSDVEVDDIEVRWHVEHRWKAGSSLRRAAYSVLGYLESKGIDLHAVHLHGEDVDKKSTAHYAGFQLRYISALPWCFAEHGGIEWIEVPHPTRSGAVTALQIQLLDRDQMKRRCNDLKSLFR